jgi:hypothetical protein
VCRVDPGGVPDGRRRPEVDRGPPFVAAGWTGQQIYESTGKGPDESARSDFGDFAIVSSTQVALVSLVLAARRVHASEDRVGDGVQFVLMLLVIANTAINAGWAWWAA